MSQKQVVERMASATLEQFNCNHTIYKGVLGIAKYSFIFFTCPKKSETFQYL